MTRTIWKTLCILLAWAAAQVAAPAAIQMASAQPRTTSGPTTQPATVSPQAFTLADQAKLAPELVRSLTATLVSMKLQTSPAMTAMAELTKQTGYDIKPYDTRQVRYASVTVSADKQPFWAVMREICSKANINLYNSGGGGDDDRRIQLAPSNWGGQGMMRASVSIQGPFLTVVSNLVRINTVNMSAPQKVNREIHVQIQTYLEPKIRATEVSYQPDIDEAVDDNGNSMTPPSQPERGRSMQSGRGIAWYGSFQLPYPTTNPGHKIARVKGHINAMIQLSSEPVEISTPLTAKETSKTVGGKKVTFKSLVRQADHYNLELVFDRGEQDVQEFYNSMNGSLPLHLSDAQGRDWRYYNSGGNSDGQTYTRKITFNKRSRDEAVGEPVKLVIEIPTSTQMVPIPFELVDLPLP